MRDMKWDRDSKVEDGIGVLTVLALMYGLESIKATEAK